MADLASFGGITRIRFKGSSEFCRTSQPLAPPLFDFRIGPTRRKSTTRNCSGTCNSTAANRTGTKPTGARRGERLYNDAILTKVANYLAASVFTFV